MPNTASSNQPKQSKQKAKCAANPRAKRTNPRALGTNPRALGTNPRAHELTKDCWCEPKVVNYG